MSKKTVLLVSLSLVLVTLAACTRAQPELVIEPETVIVPEGPVNRHSPAELYCTGLGYEYIVREIKIGNAESQTNVSVEPITETLEGPHPGNPVIPDYILQTVCVFPDGNECEEEEFISGRCGQEYSYCVQKGNKLRPGSTLKPDTNEATCVFTDGSSCPEFDFFNGSCGPATSQ